MSKKRNVSRYIKDLPADATVIRHQEWNVPMAHVETISTIATEKLLLCMGKMTSAARVKHLQRQQNPEKVEDYKNEMTGSYPMMNSIVVEVSVLRGSPDHIYIQDGSNRTEAALLALQSGVKNIRLTILVRIADKAETQSKWGTLIDTRAQIRTTTDVIGTSMSHYGKPTLSKNVKMGHIRKVNTANVNILAGCPELDLGRLDECDPKFPWGSIVNYDNINATTTEHKDVLEWFGDNFSISSKTQKRLLNAGVSTGIILSYRLAKFHKEPTDDVLRVWMKYLNGEFTHDGKLLDGFKGLHELHRRIIEDKPEAGGTQRIQSSYFQRAVFGYNMARNPSTKDREFKIGARYQIGVGRIL